MIRSAAGAEEVFEQGGAIGGEDVFRDVEAVIEKLVIAEAELGADGAEAEVAGAEDEPADPGVDERAGAHDAGLESAVDGGVLQAVVVPGRCRLAESEDLGVGGGIAGGDRLIEAGADNASAGNDDCADRDLARGFGLAGEREGFAHEALVVDHRLDIRRNSHMLNCAEDGSPYFTSLP